MRAVLQPMWVISTGAMSQPDRKSVIIIFFSFTQNQVNEITKGARIPSDIWGSYFCNTLGSHQLLEFVNGVIHLPSRSPSTYTRTLTLTYIIRYIKDTKYTNTQNFQQNASINLPFKGIFPFPCLLHTKDLLTYLIIVMD